MINAVPQHIAGGNFLPMQKIKKFFLQLAEHFRKSCVNSGEGTKQPRKKQSGI
jgi:hypothetical protein